MRWVGVVVSGLVVACAPTAAWAFSCPSLCRNDVVVASAVPESAGGVLLMTFDTWNWQDRLDQWTVRVERSMGDGVFEETPYTVEVLDREGAFVRPESFTAGEVFRVYTTVDVREGECWSSAEQPVVHEFEVVEDPSAQARLDLAVAPPRVTTEDVPYMNKWWVSDETFTAVVSEVHLDIGLPDALLAFVPELRFELYLNGRLYRDDVNHYSCLRPGWLDADRFSVDGVEERRLRGLCEVSEGFYEGRVYEGRGLYSSLSWASQDGEMSVRAFIPGSGVEWWSEEVPLTFGCPEPATVRAEDAGVGDDTEQDVWIDVVEGDTGPQGCAQGGGRSPAPLGWLGLSVALGWFVRRRG